MMSPMPLGVRIMTFACAGMLFVIAAGHFEWETPLGWLAPSRARARPVRVGRFVEVPHGVSSAHPVATEGVGPKRLGRSAASVSRNAPTKQWELRIKTRRLSGPAIDQHGTLFVGTSDGVAAVSSSGALLWERELGTVSFPPSITPAGQLAVSVHPDALVRLSIRGQELSRTHLSGAPLGSPLVLPDGSAVLATADRAVSRFGVDGRSIFRVSSPRAVRSVLASSASRIALVSGNEVMFVSFSGDSSRRVQTPAEVIVGPAMMDDGTALVVTTGGELVGTGARGRVVARWQLGIRPSRSTRLAVGLDGGVRLGAAADGLLCVDPGTGVRWRVDSEGAFPGGITVDASGVTLAINQRGRLLAIDPAGTNLWSVDTGLRTLSAPALGTDGTVYVAGSSGTIQSWR